jgi:archaellum component FlaG (FlaF/FlaG flagellin family)
MTVVYIVLLVIVGFAAAALLTAATECVMSSEDRARREADKVIRRKLPRKWR